MTMGVPNHFWRVPGARIVAARASDHAILLLSDAEAAAERWRSNLIGVDQARVIAVKPAERVARAAKPVVGQPSVEGKRHRIVATLRLRRIEDGGRCSGGIHFLAGTFAWIGDDVHFV